MATSLTATGLVSATLMAPNLCSLARSRLSHYVHAARNLKFYPLSLRTAFDGPLANVGKTFTVVNAQNKEDLMINMSTWDLLNLKVETILDLPDRLNRDYGISSKYLEKVMDEYGIQSLGKDAIEKHFGIEKQAQYMLSSTRHYSWPKGAGKFRHPSLT